ncbi:hypothetical protein SBY92_003747 [Candida maltosa Xu316]|uniref:Uncharacterized protein n=1 Tax=Candida maltosa (strain Xu316) TaxID=1245528 RepID=M3HRH6_CANMX|nr:hypothetical protein G210_4877 [Candida maltosa Xu316]
MISIHTIESILNQISHDIDVLNIPSLIELPTYTPTSSPYVTHFKLIQIQKTLQQLNNELDHFHKNKLYGPLRAQLNKLYISDLDEKVYIVDKLIEKYNYINSPQLEEQQQQVENRLEGDVNEVMVTEEEDLTSLRKRLLSSGTSKLDDSQDLTKLNEYHESIQDDILNELTELTSSLKNRAMVLSSKILGDDLNILNETNENIIKNSQLFKIIDQNLNNYLMNKTGGKISIWFLLKCAIGLVIAFMIMLIFITIIPRIR